MGFPVIARLSPEAIYQEYENKPCMIGTPAMDEFGSIYRLCKAGAAITGTIEYAVANANFAADLCTGDMATCDLYSDTAAVGDFVIRIDDDGSASTRPVNFYEGGVAHFYGASTAERQTRRIVSSTVGTSASLYITLDAPLTVAITDGAVDALPSPFSNCVNAQAEASTYETFVCFRKIPTITTGYYFWGQTAGLCVGHYISTWPGSGANDKMVYFGNTGGITSTETSGAVTTSPQRAGYGVMCNTGNYGSVYFMLQLE